MKLNLFSKFGFALPLAVMMMLGACKPDVDDGGFVPSDPELEFITESPFTADKNGGVYDIVFSSNLPWRVKSNSDWITIENPVFGAEGGEGITIRINVSKNLIEEPRTGSLTAWITDDYEQVFTVNQPAGDPPPARNVYVKPGGSGTGDSWSDATSLDNALALELYPIDVIHLAAGTYSPAIAVTGGSDTEADRTFEIKSNITIIGGYPADPADGAVSNPALNATILDGGNTANHIITVTASRIEEQKIVLQGLRIMNGKTADAAGTVTINDVAYNKHFGGGMIVAKAEVELKDCIFKDNVSNGGGGAFYGFTNASITLDNCIVDSNVCTNTGGNGGAIVMDKQSTLTVRNSSIVNNAAGSFAGAMYIYSSTLHMYNSTVSMNSSGGAGSTTANKNYGGVYLREGTAVMVNCTLQGNTSSQSGGAIGVYGTAANPASLYVVSSTITGNMVKHASSGGAAMHINSASSTCTVNLINSVISGNTRGATGTETASDITGAAGFAVERSNMIEAGITYDNAGAVVEAAPAFDYKTMLGPLADNGGATQTIKLIGTGNPAMTYGMNASQLITVGTTLPGQPDASIMGVDQTGADRGVSYMGACVKQ